MHQKKIPHPETPYMAARREWNERYSDYIASANNWRLVALGSVATAVIAVIGLAVVAAQQKVVPYVAEYDGNGELVRVAAANVATAPNNKQIVAALRNWVIGARTVYVDGRAIKNIIDHTYAMTYPGSSCFVMLSDYHGTQNPYQRAQTETVEVDVNTVVQMSDKTWQVNWTETTKPRSGQGKDPETKQYQGIVTTVIAPPTDDAQIRVNPLGIYAQQCAWTTRL